MSTTATITKGVIKKGTTVDVSYYEEIAKAPRSTTVENKAVMHNDLRDAYSKLNPHLATLCEQWKPGTKAKMVLAECEVRGFEISGEGDKEGVTLFGVRDLSTGQVVNITAPFTKFEDSGYKGIDDLYSAIGDVVEECRQYIFYGKVRPEDVDNKVEEGEDDE